MRASSAALALLAAAALLAGTAAFDETVVQTSLGPVRGTVMDSVRAFLGIPYAAPPVLQRRFASPLPAASWGPSEYDATGFKPGCPQTCVLPPHTCPNVTSEDCLYLNVFTPRMPDGPPSSPLPVHVFIHGGRFMQGGIDTFLYSGRYYANSSDAILVTIQYRLGALAFLSYNNLTGSYGIEDQQTALRWVRDNIAGFGGDPSSVSIFGQSAGAMSVASHLVSPASKGLFHSATLESDPLPLRFREQSDAQDQGSVFMKDLGCDTGTYEEQYQCLLTVSVDKILAAEGQAGKHLYLKHPLEVFVPWVPTIGEVVPSQPLDGILAGTWNKVPITIGSVRNDSVMFVYDAFTSSMSALEFDALIVAIFGLSDGDKIMDRYAKTDDNRLRLSLLVTDFLFYCPARAIAAAASAAGVPAYLYRWDHYLSFDSSWGQYTMCERDGNVCHGSELPFVFNSSAIDGFFSPSADEVTLSGEVMAQWGRFGNAADHNLAGRPQWQPYTASSPVTMVFNAPHGAAEADLSKDACEFWDGIGYSHG